MTILTIEAKRERQKLYQQRWREKNPEYMKTFRCLHKKELHQYNKVWSSKNLDKRAQTSARYRVKKLSASPKWLTEDDYFCIAEFYKLAKFKQLITGEVYHVDHVIPLQGKFVSGLHVPENLRVIRSVDNYKKKNKFSILHE